MAGPPPGRRRSAGSARRCPAPGRCTVPAGPAARPAGRPAAGPSRRRSASRSVTRQDSCLVAYRPYSAASSASRCGIEEPSAASVAASSAISSAAEMPSLSRTSSRRHRVAERLLVAVDQIRCGPGDPLEAGEGLGERHAVLGRHRRQHRARRRWWSRRCRECPCVAANRPAARPPRRRAASASRRAANGHADRAPVGVRVVGDDQVGPGPVGQRQRQVHRAGLLRIGEGHRREVRVRHGLLGHLARGGEAGRGEHRPQHLGADPVHRGVHDAQLAGRVRRHQPGDRRGRRRRRSIRPGSGSPVASGIARAESTARIWRLDLGIHRRHDLRAVGGIDLVAVVLRRVVRGGHHHPGRRAEVADREGQHRGRQQPGQQPGVEAGGGEDRRGVLRRTPGTGAGRRSRSPRSPPASPAAVSCAAMPAAARRTTAAFIPFGPARSGPRRPAVPKVSGPANRSASSACVDRPSEQRLQLGGVARRPGRRRSRRVPRAAGRLAAVMRLAFRLVGNLVDAEAGCGEHAADQIQSDGSVGGSARRSAGVGDRLASSTGR